MTETQQAQGHQRRSPAKLSGVFLAESNPSFFPGRQTTPMGFRYVTKTS